MGLSLQFRYLEVIHLRLLEARVDEERYDRSRYRAFYCNADGVPSEVEINPDDIWFNIGFTHAAIAER